MKKMAQNIEDVVADSASAGRVVPRRLPRIASRKKTAIAGFVLMAPSLVFIGLFVMVPIVYVVYLSLYKSNLLTPHPKFVFLQNYVQLFSDVDFLGSLKNSALLSGGMLFLSLPIGCLLAALLNMRLKGTKFYRTVFFAPYVLPLVGSGLVFTLLLDKDNGLVNHVLALVGVPPINWLGSSHTALISVMLVSLWQYSGYYMLIFLAGLQNIPQSLVEACQVDGGGRLKSFIHVTLPNLTPTIFFCAVVCIIQSFQAFDQVYVMTDGGPNNASSTLTYYIFHKGFQMYDIGSSAAASVILLILLSILSLIQIRLGRRWVVEES
ncbi:hypothetical protein N007_12940 [Alicyclobacillus acidoterrestris ATCC 49025]|nr:hypothetical protein N007_12940 [Alicyclobacillus acidoterrestris ATCC 49025]